MTIYIRRSINPDIVTRYDEVKELIVERDDQIVSLYYNESGRMIHISLNNVISLESN